jgi:hypothetical protein
MGWQAGVHAVGKGVEEGVLRQAPYDRLAADPDALAALVRQAIARQTDMLG